MTRMAGMIGMIGNWGGLVGLLSEVLEVDLTKFDCSVIDSRFRKLQLANFAVFNLRVNYSFNEGSW